MSSSKLNYLDSSLPDYILSQNGLTEIIESKSLNIGQELELPWTADRLLASRFEINGNDLWIINGDAQLIINDWTMLEQGLSWLSSDSKLINGNTISQFIQPEHIEMTSISSYSETVAIVQSVKGDAWATDSNGIKNKLSKGDSINQGTIVDTGENGYIKLQLADKSTLTLGSEGKYSINDFSFDGQSQAGVTLMSILKGAFSFVSGLIARENPENVRIFTPTAEIGIRGTKLIGEVSSDGETEVVLIQGRILIVTESQTFQLFIPLNGVKVGQYSSSLITFSNINELLTRYNDAVPGQTKQLFLKSGIETNFEIPGYGLVDIEETTIPTGYGIQASSVSLPKLDSVTAKNDILNSLKQASTDDIGNLNTIYKVVIPISPVEKNSEKPESIKPLSTIPEIIVEKGTANYGSIDARNVNGLINIYVNILDSKSGKVIDNLQYKVSSFEGVYKFDVLSEFALKNVFDAYTLSEYNDDYFVFVGIESLTIDKFSDYGFLTSQNGGVPLISKIFLSLTNSGNKDSNDLAEYIESKYIPFIDEVLHSTKPELVIIYGSKLNNGKVSLRDAQSVIEGDYGLIDSYSIVYEYTQSSGPSNTFNRITDKDKMADILELHYITPLKINGVNTRLLYSNFESNLDYVNKFILNIELINNLNMNSSLTEASDLITVNISEHLSNLISNSVTQLSNFVIEIHLQGTLVNVNAKYKVNLFSGSNILFLELDTKQPENIKSHGSHDYISSHVSSDGSLYNIKVVVYNDLSADLNDFILMLN